MTNYESDSSDDDLDVQTNVLLGYVTGEPAGDDISHVGGHPTWLDESCKPSAALARCKICNGYMSLLLQLQASLKDSFPGDDRSLFIWCCRKRSCSKKQGSIRCFREVRKAKVRNAPPLQSKPQEEQKPAVGLGTQLFGGPAPTNGNANPFSSSSTPSTTNPFSTAVAAVEAAVGPLSDLAAKTPQPPTQTFAEKLRISDDKPAPAPIPETWPTEDEFPTPLPRFYLDAEGEYLEPAPAPTASSSRITELDEAEGSSGAAEKDLYESPHDKTFDHFTRILSQNAEQVLRYEHQGAPLLYSSSDSIATHFVLPGHVKSSGPVKGIPRCGDCGSARVFECQLVPNLIYELEKDNEEAMKLDGGEGMEWGTIIVGTCNKNCGEPGAVVFREEWVGVQWEEGGVELKQKK